MTYPNIVGAVVWTAPSDNSYLFFVRNYTGINSLMTITVTELKR